MDSLVPSVLATDEVADFSKFNQAQQIATCYLTKYDPRDQQIRKANDVIGTGLQNMFTEKPNLFSYEECINALSTYFTNLAERSIRPSFTGMCLALGITRGNFLQICNTGTMHSTFEGADISLPREIVQLCINLKENFASMIETFMESGLIHPVCGIFLLKNNAEYKDTVEHSYNITKATVDLNDMARKYNLAQD